jgi:uncharacterized RmlC-like cupin family protein
MRIEGVRISKLQTVADARGGLTIAEAPRHVPFEIKRIFFMYGVGAGASRGTHAHRTLEEMVVAASGSLRVRVDDGRGAVREFALAAPDDALYLPPMVWVELFDFTPGTVALVLASDVYVEADYFRDRAEFERAVEDVP